MSTTQRNDVCVLTVDRRTAAVIRRQTIIVLEDNHHAFEDLLELGAEAQFALSVIFRDAFAVLDTLGWPVARADETIDVPLTFGHVEQLRRRRRDLGARNIDRLDGIGDPADIDAIRPELDADRLAAQALDRLFTAYFAAAR
jgi:hypothetical protein